MRREVIELLKSFKKALCEIETELIFTAETDFEKIEKFLKEFNEIMLKYSKQAETLRKKTEEKRKMLKI
jgi:hypothetical protein